MKPDSDHSTQNSVFREYFAKNEGCIGSISAFKIIPSIFGVKKKSIQVSTRTGEKPRVGSF
jgi:hypothetical protein